MHDVELTLAQHGIAPNRLVLEITEDVIGSLRDELTDVLDRLHELGVRLAIDDFGTGTSSLDRLRHGNFDVIKIAKPFVDGLPASQSDAALIRAVIDLARAFNMTVVAEGVERQEQLDALQELGCHTIQGFLLGRPQSGALLHSLLADRSLPRAA